jgi:ABC-2 type transport system permease protein
MDSMAEGSSMIKAVAFLTRDWRIHSSYRLTFLMELLYLFLNIIPYFFLAKFIGPSVSGSLQQYGGDYFLFVLVGLVLQEYLTVPLTLFSRHIRESQLNGTLEALLSTQTSLNEVVLFSALYPFFWATLNVVMYFVFGIAFLGVRFENANWAAAVFIKTLAVLVFCGIGIL